MTCTFTSAPANGVAVVVYRNRPVERTDTDYQPNGDFAETTVDADFDNNGIAFLNLAWQLVLSISLDLPAQRVEELGEDATEEQRLKAEDDGII